MLTAIVLIALGLAIIGGGWWIFDEISNAPEFPEPVDAPESKFDDN